MKHLFRSSLLASALLLVPARMLAVPAVTPYLETASVTFLGGFTVTGVAKTKTALPVGGIGVLDPEILKPTDRVATDVGTPINYTRGTADQSFFVKHLLRATSENLARQSRAVAIERADALASIQAEIALLQSAIAAIDAQLAIVTDPNDRDALITQRTALEVDLADAQDEADGIAAPYDEQLLVLEAKIKYIIAESDDSWEITSVRNAQSTLAGATSTPFSLFLSRTDRTRLGITRTFDTGLRLTPIYSAGSSAESFFSGNLTGVTGSYTTHISLEFVSLYATDPLSSLDPLERATAVEGVDYNTAGERWEINATGYMTYTLRSTAGPTVAVLPSNIKITGHGSWEHLTNYGALNPVTYAGLAPLSIKMGAIKYQNRNIFPDFLGDVGP